MLFLGLFQLHKDSYKIQAAASQLGLFFVITLIGLEL